MRLMGTLSSDEALDPHFFSSFLTNQGIDNQIEEAVADSKKLFRIWITDEDRVKEAQQLLLLYKKDPGSSQFQHFPKEESPIEILEQQKQEEPKNPPSGRFGLLCTLMICAVIACFFWSQSQKTFRVPPKIPGVLQAPIMAPIERALIYDYPTYFQLRDQLFSLWTPQQIQEGLAPPQEAIALIQTIKKQPIWMGAYDRIVARLKNSKNQNKPDPILFEKISKGEYWRLVTPILLHFDLLHIFFNLLWFIILGPQLESRLGTLRTLVFIVVAAAISNTVQYLISGPFFMGLSGVICAMAAFIWTRQRIAPWEGYLLNRSTLIFLALFVMGMFALSLFFFFLQLFQNIPTFISIANGAHISGAIVGYLLGKNRLFATKLK